jgi:dUTP pyrophosphatase
MDNKMYLKVFVNSSDADVLDTYTNHITAHNSKLENDAPYEDSGFDIYIPSSTTFQGNSVTKVNMEIKCAAYINNTPCGFYVYPRSSISKTPIRLANQVGIIDAGYRGCLIGAFDNIRKEDYHVEANTRLLQVCGPSLQPINVELVYSEDDLGQTNRGAGGFGSTGSMESFINSLGHLSSFSNNVNNQSAHGYMDIAKEMEYLLANNLMNSHQENNMNILDEDVDIDSETMIIEPVD